MGVSLIMMIMISIYKSDILIVLHSTMYTLVIYKSILHHPINHTNLSIIHKVLTCARAGQDGSCNLVSMLSEGLHKILLTDWLRTCSM